MFSVRTTQLTTSFPSEEDLLKRDPSTFLKSATGKAVLATGVVLLAFGGVAAAGFDVPTLSPSTNEPTLQDESSGDSSSEATDDSSDDSSQDESSEATDESSDDSSQDEATDESSRRFLAHDESSGRIVAMTARLTIRRTATSCRSSPGPPSSRAVRRARRSPTWHRATPPTTVRTPCPTTTRATTKATTNRATTQPRHPRSRHRKHPATTSQTDDSPGESGNRTASPVHPTASPVSRTASPASTGGNGDD